MAPARCVAADGPDGEEAVSDAPAGDLRAQIVQALALRPRETPDPLRGPGQAFAGVRGEARERPLERLALVAPASTGGEAVEHAGVREQGAVAAAAHVADDPGHPRRHRFVHRRTGARLRFPGRHQGQHAQARGSVFAAPRRRVNARARRSRASPTDASDTPQRRSRTIAK